MIQHPEEQLSAYLDGALEPDERTGLETHLAACAHCRSRLAELREVGRLLAALPERAPRRSLVPRRIPAWLFPARLVSGLATGAFAFLFFVNSMTFLAPPGAPGAPAQQFAPAAPAAAPRPEAATPKPVTADTASPKAAEQQQRSALATQASPSPTADVFTGIASRPTPVPRGEVPAERDAVGQRVQQLATIPPLAWLVAALLAGVATFGLHRTIRRYRS